MVSSLQAAIHNKLSPQLHLFLSYHVGNILRKKNRKKFCYLWEKMNLKRSQCGIPNKGKEQKVRNGVIQTIVQWRALVFPAQNHQG